MKRYYINLLLILASLAFIVPSCTEDTDIMTGNVQVGGLVTPTLNIPYKLGATPSFDVSVLVHKGPAISKIEVFKIFVDITGAKTNEALLGTIDVSGSNLNESVNVKLNVTYADLIKDLKLNGVALPESENDLNIGDAWSLTYKAVMTDESREVFNATKTKIGVANQYAGTYLCTGFFHHPTAGTRPINEEKFLTPVDAYTCWAPLGDLGSAGYDIYIVVDPLTNNCTITVGPGAATDVFMTEGKENKYYPDEKKFVLNYYYIGGNGNRVIEEVYTLVE